MDDPWVKLGWTVLRALPQDAYAARLAVHSLVWEIWRLEQEAHDERAR